MKPDFFIRNRQALFGAAKCDQIVVTANGLLQRNGDTTYAFRQDSNFWYLTGINNPDITLVIDGTSEYLIVPGRDRIHELFDGAVDYKALQRQSGVKTVLNDVDGWQRLTKSLKRAKRVGLLEPSAAYVEHYDFYSNPAKAKLKNQILKFTTTKAVVGIKAIIAEQRVIKKPEEIKLIKKAVDITISTINEVFRARASFQYEYEVEAAITHGFRSRGASGHAFEPIVASGKNASTIHYFSNNARLENNGLLLLDIGAEVENYGADISRTFSIDKPSKRQAVLLAVAQEVQTYAINIIRPGLNFYDFELKIEKHMGRELKKLGLITDTKRSSIRKYFPHAASHFLGLDVHDVGYRRQDLKPNMVLAIEPGIIIEAEGIGVRIEDNLVITRTGCKVLSDNLPQVLSSTTM